jgi:uncharacterized protein
MRTTIALAAALLAAALPSTCLAQDPVRSIGEVQGEVGVDANGATHRSSFAPPTGNGSSTAFVTTRGVVRQKIVTRTGAGDPNFGFFLQSTPDSTDNNPLTSDGIFVFMGRFTTLIGGTSADLQW